MNEKQKLRMQIHQYDFALIELNLFLDTHPRDRKALMKFKALKERREMLVKAYEQRFGPYIVTAHNAAGEDHWHWIHSPWPWEESECEA